MPKRWTRHGGGRVENVPHALRTGSSKRVSPTGCTFSRRLIRRSPQGTHLRYQNFSPAGSFHILSKPYSLQYFYSRPSRESIMCTLQLQLVYKLSPNELLCFRCTSELLRLLESIARTVEVSCRIFTSNPPVQTWQRRIRIAASSYVRLPRFLPLGRRTTEPLDEPATINDCATFQPHHPAGRHHNWSQASYFANPSPSPLSSMLSSDRWTFFSRPIPSLQLTCFADSGSICDRSARHRLPPMYLPRAIKRKQAYFRAFLRYLSSARSTLLLL